MNIETTNTPTISAPVANVGDKVYKIIVPILLILILGVQIFGIVNKPTPSQSCLDAIAAASQISGTIHTQLMSSLTDYKDAVYKRADNINQQIFLANENVFMNMTSLALLQDAALNVQLACR